MNTLQFGIATYYHIIISKQTYFKKNDGSLVLYPLKFPRNNVFGLIGIDTLQQNQSLLNDTAQLSSFSEDELKFYKVNLVFQSFLKKYVAFNFCYHEIRALPARFRKPTQS